MTGESDMLTVLNSPGPLDTECAKQKICKDALLSIFDESQKIEAQILLTNQDSQNDANKIGYNNDWGNMVKMNDQLRRSNTDDRILELLKAVECHTKSRLSQLGSEMT